MRATLGYGLSVANKYRCLPACSLIVSQTLNNCPLCIQRLSFHEPDTAGLITGLYCTTETLNQHTSLSPLITSYNLQA